MGFDYLLLRLLPLSLQFGNYAYVLSLFVQLGNHACILSFIGIIRSSCLQLKPITLEVVVFLTINPCNFTVQLPGEIIATALYLYIYNI